MTPNRSTTADHVMLKQPEIWNNVKALNSAGHKLQILTITYFMHGNKRNTSEYLIKNKPCLTPTSFFRQRVFHVILLIPSPVGQTRSITISETGILTSFLFGWLQTKGVPCQAGILSLQTDRMRLFFQEMSYDQESSKTLQ